MTEIFSQRDSKIKICPYVPLHSFIRNLRCSDVLKVWKISSCKYLKFRKSIIFISAIHCKISLVRLLELIISCLLSRLTLNFINVITITVSRHRVERQNHSLTLRGMLRGKNWSWSIRKFTSSYSFCV